MNFLPISPSFILNFYQKRLFTTSPCSWEEAEGFTTEKINYLAHKILRMDVTFLVNAPDITLGFREDPSKSFEIKWGGKWDQSVTHHFKAYQTHRIYIRKIAEAKKPTARFTIINGSNIELYSAELRGVSSYFLDLLLHANNQFPYSNNPYSLVCKNRPSTTPLDNGTNELTSPIHTSEPFWQRPQVEEPPTKHQKRSYSSSPSPFTSDDKAYPSSLEGAIYDAISLPSCINLHASDDTLPIFFASGDKASRRPLEETISNISLPLFPSWGDLRASNDFLSPN